MFERFTDKARSVVVSAQAEAAEMKHHHIGTEHLLLGLMLTKGFASQVLEDLHVPLANTRGQVLEHVPAGEQEPSGHVPFTPNAKKTLEGALREALQLGHNYIGTEHILLALCRNVGTVGYRVIESFIEPEVVAQTVTEKLGGQTVTSEAPPPPIRYNPPFNSLRAILDSLKAITALLESIDGRLESIDGRLYTLEQAAEEAKS